MPRGSRQRARQRLASARRTVVRVSSQARLWFFKPTRLHFARSARLLNQCISARAAQNWDGRLDGRVAPSRELL